MKRIFLSLIALLATMSINAEVITVYENDKISDIYLNTPENIVKVVFEEVPEHEYVDLGLSVKWATCNVGAEKCYDYGDYFAWGETIGYTGYNNGKTSFSWDNYTLCQTSRYDLTKYCIDSYYGPVDNKTVLEASDDAATAKWGSAWRMPTYDELSELNNTSNCSWTWYYAGNDEFNGVAGYKVQSLKAGYTDKYIFLPAAGYRYDSSFSGAGNAGHYWSSSLDEDITYGAWELYVSHVYSDVYYMNPCYRNDGMSVRPVRASDKDEKTQIVKVYVNGELTATYTNTPTNTVEVVFEDEPTAHEYVEIGGVKWATMNVGATTVAGSPSTCYGDYFAWGETEPRYTSMTISSDGTSATFGGWSSSHSSGYSSDDYPTYTGTTLDAAHDAATQNWGSDWRTPTKDDFKALVNACTGSSDSSQTISKLLSSSPTGGIYWLSSEQIYLLEYKGVAGYLFVDKTDTSKRVFFPASGVCDDTNFNRAYGGCNYWSSSLYYESDYITCAYFMGMQRSCIDRGYIYRFHGFTIRPVLNTDK